MLVEIHLESLVYWKPVNVVKMFSFVVLSTYTETGYTFYIQKLYKMYTVDVYKIFTDCMQNVYLSHFNKLLYTF